MNQAKIDAVNALHMPEAYAQDMVYEVWEDGEITLTKGGDLYGQRNLHMIDFGNPAKSLGADVLFYKSVNHSSIAVMTYEQAQQAQALIFGV